jgi:hypothetical protein
LQQPTGTTAATGGAVVITVSASATTSYNQIFNFTIFCNSKRRVASVSK